MNNYDQAQEKIPSTENKSCGTDKLISVQISRDLWITNNFCTTTNSTKLKHEENEIQWGASIDRDLWTQ